MIMTLFLKKSIHSSSAKIVPFSILFSFSDIFIYISSAETVLTRLQISFGLNKKHGIMSERLCFFEAKSGEPTVGPWDLGNDWEGKREEEQMRLKSMGKGRDQRKDEAMRWVSVDSEGKVDGSAFWDTRYCHRMGWISKPSLNRPKTFDASVNTAYYWVIFHLIEFIWFDALARARMKMAFFESKKFFSKIWSSSSD